MPPPFFEEIIMEKKRLGRLLKGAEGFIFDLDGTLIDSETVMSAINREILEKAGKEKVEYYLELIKGTTFTVQNQLFKEIFGNSLDFDFSIYHEKLINELNQAIEGGKIPLKEGANEILELTKSIGKIGLATSTGEERGRYKLLHSPLESQLFDNLIFGDHIEASKPDPEIFLTVAKNMGVDPAGTVVFEDSNKGALAGIRGGFITLFIKDLSEPTEEVKQGVYGNFNSLNEIIALMRS